MWDFQPLEEILPQERFIIRSLKYFHLGKVAVEGEELVRMFPLFTTSFTVAAVALKVPSESVSSYALGQGL